jgi:hypothetical protein
LRWIERPVLEFVGRGFLGSEVFGSDEIDFGRFFGRFFPPEIEFLPVHRPADDGRLRSDEVGSAHDGFHAQDERLGRGLGSLGRGGRNQPEGGQGKQGDEDDRSARVHGTLLVRIKQNQNYMHRRVK